MPADARAVIVRPIRRAHGCQVANFEEKKGVLSERLRTSAGEVRLQKNISHLFRGRSRPPSAKLDVRAFDEVLGVDTSEGTVDVEGMTSYAKLADATFAHGLLPAVVPQLKSITIGGACAGLGIEASSFRYGLAHETVDELEVLLADGDVVVCTPTNAHSDLFFGLPNSFGTLGYALRVKAKAIRAKKFVELNHVRYGDPDTFFRELASCCARPDVDFVDGVVFGPGEHYLNIGRFVDEAPYASDYTFENIYYRSIRERERDYLTALDYIWRWDTDWFWCSRMFHAQNPVVRRLLGRKYLNSTFYKRAMDWEPGVRLRQVRRRLLGIHREAIVQDVDVTVERAPAFLEFFQREIGLTPVWICPFKAYAPRRGFPLFPTDPNALYINFGFWDSKFTPTSFPEGHFNRLIEHKLAELGGIKSLYSDSYFTPEEFAAAYNKPAYDKLKVKYDPKGRLSDLYRKCVLRQ
jgi:FAD/FMN-containing dehydrogenase